MSDECQDSPSTVINLIFAIYMILSLFFVSGLGAAKHLCVMFLFVKEGRQNPKEMFREYYFPAGSDPGFGLGASAYDTLFGCTS